MMTGGWLPDPHDPRDFDARAMPGLSGGILMPADVDLSPHVDMIRDQGLAEECVAQTIARCLHMRASIEGRRILYPSTRALYYAARLLETGDHSRITNRGSYPRLALDAASKIGLCAESRWPPNPHTIDVPPSWDCAQHAIDARVDGYYRVTGDGEFRLDTMRRCLAAGQPLHVGFTVDKQLFDLGDGILGPIGDPTGGRHAMAVIGYQPGWFLVCNSWGRSWGFGGYGRISDERMGAADTGDVWAFRVAPRSIT